MKKIISFLLLVFAYVNAYSQNVTVQLSPDVNDESANPEIFGINEQAFFAISSKSEGEFYIESFAIKELRRVYKKRIELPKTEDKPNVFENIFYLNSHIYLVSSHQDKKLKKYTVYINEIKPNGELSLNHTVIDEISFNNKNYNCKYTFGLSSDSNRILLFRQYYDGDEAKEKVTYKAISKGLKVVNSKDLELSGKPGKTAIANVLMDDEQNLYYTEKQYYKSETEAGNLTRLFAVTYKPETDSAYRTEIAMKETYFLDVNLQFNVQGNLICSGNYSVDKTFGANLEENHGLKGIFYTIMDSKNLSILSQAHNNLQELFPDEKFYHYYLTNTYQLSENNLTVLCEFQHTVCDNGNCDQKFGDLLITKFDLNETKNVSTKKIETTSKGEKLLCKGGTRSFISFQANRTVQLLYNCNKQYVIDADGNATMKNLYEDSANESLAFMKSSFRVNKNELLVLTYSKKTGHRFAKFSVVK